MLKSLLLATVALFPGTALSQSPPKLVFAHHIVGVTAQYSLADWQDDVQKASGAGIDGFALNIGSQDSYTTASLNNAFTAAGAYSNFCLFISFDYAAQGPFTISQVVNILNTYKSSPSYCQYLGKPLVSTFEGPGNSGDWVSIKSQVPITFIPDWTSIGPQNTVNTGVVDGAFNWNAWPVGATNMNTGDDVAYLNALQGKPYMMGVSPGFYTNLPAYGKNWVWRGDDLWYDRWQQVISLQPALVEIITWNDFGESHYIGPIRPQGVVPGADYVAGRPHEAWLNELRLFIYAYKTGTDTNHAYIDINLVYWYRTTPVLACPEGSTAGNAPYQPYTDPTTVVQDKIFLDAILPGPGEVHVQIGTNPTRIIQATHAGINHLSVPFNGETGGSVQFQVIFNGHIISTVGPGITTNCNGAQTNFNVFVGGV
ncbi:MAG: hypothetical protein M1829_001587 [Trizodia sp. TS-e1964]|nr:MAG: hypothetical protein M1829_001587 [Trizodia sp. TS-e1964]